VRPAKVVPREARQPKHRDIVVKPGETVLDRYELMKQLCAPPGQVRWSATDTAGGDRAEIVMATKQVALRPGAAEHFLQAQARDTAAVAVLPVAVVGQVDGQPAAARPPVRRVSPDARLTPEQALEWAAWIAPAAQAASTALGGDLSPADLVVDDGGVLRLSPAGLVPARQAVRPARHRAPELRAGATPGAGSALYGLGVTLFHAVTGAWPVQAATEAALATAGPPRRARELMPDLPEDLDQLLAALLDQDPQVRIAAAAALPSPSTLVPPQDVLCQESLKPAANKPMPLASAPRTRHSTATAHEDKARPAWVVVTDTSSHSRPLSDAAIGRVSALLDVSEDVLQSVTSQGLLVPIRGARTEDEAHTLALEYADQGIPTQVRPDGAVGAAAAATVALGLGTGFLMTLTTAMLGLGLVGGPLGIALLLSLVTASAVAGLFTFRRGRAARERAALDRARRQLLAPRASKDDPPALSRLRGVRRRIIQADLPIPMRLDLESAAQDLRSGLGKLPTQQPLDTRTGGRFDTLLGLLVELELAVEAASTVNSDRSLEQRVRSRTQLAKTAATQVQR